MAEMLTDERLAEIKGCHKRSTPGDWKPTCRDSSGGMDSAEMSGLGWEVDGPPEPLLRGQFRRGEDAIFIANAHQDIPDLLDHIAALSRAQEATDAND